jgi:hypothetical protein
MARKPKENHSNILKLWKFQDDSFLELYYIYLCLKTEYNFLELVHFFERVMDKNLGQFDI